MHIRFAMTLNDAVKASKSLKRMTKSATVAMAASDSGGTLVVTPTAIILYVKHTVTYLDGFKGKLNNRT